MSIVMCFIWENSLQIVFAFKCNELLGYYYANDSDEEELIRCLAQPFLGWEEIRQEKA